MGTVGNDGTGNVDYAASIANRIAAPGAGAFRGGETTATIHADFDANFAALNGSSAGSGGGSYAVNQGDTLAGIAALLWGDANLWYKLAEANPGAASGGLAAGMVLTVPGGVQGVHHNASTFKPYDPAEALGNVSPNTPKPPKQSNKCGAFGQLLVVAIAIAVTVVLKVPLTNLIAGPQAAAAATAAGTGIAAGSAAGIAGAVGAAAAGSVVSQTFGVATGIQDQFSWKGVALAGIGAGVGAGILGKFGAAANAWGAAAQAAAGNAITQGIGIATGLQSRFDFAGVAAAGVGGGIGHEVGARIGGSEVANFAASVSAAGIANAATRSAIKGNSFGDNLIAALPDLMAQIAVRAIGTAFDGVSAPPTEGKGQTVGEAVAEDLKYRAEIRGYAMATSRLSGGSQWSGGESFSPASEASISDYRRSWREKLQADVAAEGGSDLIFYPDGGASYTGADGVGVIASEMAPVVATIESPPISEGSVIGDFFNGVFYGDFSDRGSGSASFGKVVGGFIPLSDVRDTGAAITHIFQGKDGAWGDLGLSVVGFVPVLGDLAKGALKHGDEAVDAFGETRRLGGAAERVAINPRLTTRLGKWKDYQASGGPLDMKDWIKATQGQSWGLGGKGGFGDWSRRVDSSHGNSLFSNRPASLYEMYDRNTGEFLKHGITQDLPGRYSTTYLGDKRVIITQTGPRSQIAPVERFLEETQPGRLNRQSWAVKAWDQGLGRVK